MEMLGATREKSPREKGPSAAHRQERDLVFIHRVADLQTMIWLQQCGSDYCHQQF